MPRKEHMKDQVMFEKIDHLNKSASKIESKLVNRKGVV